MSIVILLLAIGFSPRISAQEESPNYQTFYVGDEMVKPSMIAEYELAVKEHHSLYKEAEYPYRIYVYSTYDNHYYYVTPIEKISNLDSIQKYVNKVAKMNPEKWKASWSKFEGTYEYYNPKVIIWVKELSYEPVNKRLKSGESNFHYWMYLYLDPNKTNDFIEIMTKAKELFKNKNIQDGYDVYWGSIGTEQPMAIIAMWGKNDADFWKQDKINMDILGDDIMSLNNQVLKLTRKTEIKLGWFRPELSYFIKE